VLLLNLQIVGFGAVSTGDSVVPFQQISESGPIAGINSLCPQAFMPGHFSGVTHQSHCLMPTLQDFVQDVGADKTRRADQCHFHRSS
jgi:hypothetical protein